MMFVLSEASTLEHMIMCEYLFAAFSLKKSEEEGLTRSQLDTVRNWEGVVTNVAIQEMGHLALVNNMLVSIGSAPYFEHANFPQPSKYFSPNIKLALIPFGEQALRHFVYLERPEGMSVEGVPGFEILGDLNPAELKGGISPHQQYFSTVGNLYRGVERGFKALVEKYGEERLFIGGGNSQATEEVFGLQGLTRVDSLEAATRGVEGIVEMGEGARGDWRNAHFGMFLGVLKEFEELKAKDPGFRPTKPVVAAYARPPVGAGDVPLITEGFTIKVADLFNTSYSLAIMTLSRFFIHGVERKGELQSLADTAVGLMSSAIKPLADALTSLPVGARLPGLNAGPTFELQQRAYALPHADQALEVLKERLGELSENSRALSEEAHSSQVSEKLREVSVSFSDLGKGLLAG